jgi:3,4-dihydroxy 2-butanone 4-phosphate synthase/GTP cyclohydrolase II
VSRERTLASIPEVLEDLSAGRMIILVDDEDRENEGDLVCLAEKVTPEIVNFMARHARGLICLPMDKGIADELDLPLQVERNQSRLGTAFTVSIEARSGVTTGISAADRARTVLTAARLGCRPDELVRPGHIRTVDASRRRAEIGPRGCGTLRPERRSQRSLNTLRRSDPSHSVRAASAS